MGIVVESGMTVGCRVIQALKTNAGEESLAALRQRISVLGGWEG